MIKAKKTCLTSALLPEMVGTFTTTNHNMVTGVLTYKDLGQITGPLVSRNDTDAGWPTKVLLSVHGRTNSRSMGKLSHSDRDSQLLTQFPDLIQGIHGTSFSRGSQGPLRSDSLT